MEPISSNATQSTDQPAGFWLRLAAALVDNFIINCVTFVVLVVLSIFFIAQERLVEIITSESQYPSVLYVALVLLYKAACEASSMRGTPGKRLVGIAVVTAAAQRVSFIRALLRNSAKIFSYITACLGFLMAALPGQKRCLHDLLTGCCVIRAR